MNGESNDTAAHILGLGTLGKVPEGALTQPSLSVSCHWERKEFRGNGLHCGDPELQRSFGFQNKKQFSGPELRDRKVTSDGEASGPEGATMGEGQWPGKQRCWW